MRKFIIILFGLIIFLSGTNFAQDKSTNDLNLPKMTIEQRMNRLMLNTAGMIVNSIGYIKSVGGNAADLGKYIGNVFAKAWSPIKGRGPRVFVEAMYNNYQSDLDNKFEVLEQTDTSITYKVTRFLGSKMVNFYSDNVTEQDIDDCYEMLLKTIANSVGLNYSQKAVPDGMVITVSE